MSDSNQPTPAQSSSGCGTLAIAIIALLVALAANNKAGGDGSRQTTRFLANDVNQLEQQARNFEQQVKQLESRIAVLEKQ